MTPLERLILQRTRPYIALAGKEPLREWTRTGRTDHLVPALEERNALLRYLEQAHRELRDDAEDVLQRIGARRPRHLVSIGPGGGHVEAILAERLGLSSMLLVDIESGGHGHGFGADGAGYCVLAAAADRARIYAPLCRVETWNPDRQAAPVFPFDLCVSLYAMGFHFPRDLYAEWLAGNARPGAVEVYDDRQRGERVTCG